MIRVHLTSTRTGTVHYRPHWLLFWHSERDYEIESDGVHWFDRTTGREVADDVDREITRAVYAQRMQAQGRR